jgi:hypothetical protein
MSHISRRSKHEREPYATMLADRQANYDMTDAYLVGEIGSRPVVSSFIHHKDLYSAVLDVLVFGRQILISMSFFFSNEIR